MKIEEVLNDYRKTTGMLTIEDFTEFTADGKTLVTEDWNSIFRLRVPIGLAYELGNNDGTNIGLLYAKIRDATDADIKGKIRFMVVNVNRTKFSQVKDFNYDAINVTKTDKQTGVFLNETDMIAMENRYIDIQFMPTEAGKVLTKANCDLQLPITIYEQP